MQDLELSTHHLSRTVLCRSFMRLLPEEFCRQRGVVLLGLPPESNEDEVTVGLVDLTDDETNLRLQEFLVNPIRCIRVNAFEIDEAIDFAFSEPEIQEETRYQALSPVVEKLWVDAHRTISLGPDQKPSGMVRDLIATAIRKRASDIHLEVFSKTVQVRIRVDGHLKCLETPLELMNYPQIISHLKVIADMDITEHRRSQDGHIILRVREEDGTSRRVDLRMAFLPGPHGEDCVLRILDEYLLSLDLEQLGMTGEKFPVFHRLIHEGSGLFLVSGPTGSGKTTTMYAIIKHIKEMGRKILTVEDPIEYEVPLVNQKQVSHHMTFAAYTRAFLRQNPDVIMVGEIRDEETAQIVVRAGQVGHLVLATLHAQDSPAAVSRMLSLGADPSLLASSLLGVVNQRLVRLICPSCKEPYQPDDETLDLLPDLPSDMTFFRGRGCNLCQGTGYHGRTGLFEILPFAPFMRKAIAAGEGKYPGSLPLPPTFKRMSEYGIDKVKAGLTTAEDLALAIRLAS